MGEFDGDVEHIKRESRHPCRAVALGDAGAVGKREAAVEHADVVEAEESAFKDIVSRLIDAVRPPAVVEEEFVECLFEEGAVACALRSAFDGINPPRRPAADGRVGIRERPLIGGLLRAG